MSSERKRCPTCGEPVRTVTGDEGTAHFESVAAAEVERLQDKLVEVNAVHADEKDILRAEGRAEVERLEQERGIEREEAAKYRAEVEQLREVLLAHFFGRYTERFPVRAATTNFLAELCEAALAEEYEERLVMKALEKERDEERA